MHYYNRHIGDYARETGHLTAEEHGAMTLLMDRYYLKEMPIQHDQAARIAKVDQAVVDRLLAEFFVRDGGVWRHAGADKAIAKYHANSVVNRENGKKGGRPRKEKPAGKPEETGSDSERKPDGGANENPDETQLKSESKPAENPNQEPITINQEKNPPSPPVGGAAAPPRRRRKVASRVPGTENYSASFLRFWDAYPSGKRSKKDEAYAVWKRDKLADFEETLIEDVKNRAANHWGWIKENGAYIPGAQVYLNGHRWNDDIEDPPRGWQRHGAGRREATEQANDETAERWARQNAGGQNFIE